MSDTYSGIIVGGSLAGKKLTSATRTFQMRVFPPIDLFGGNKPSNEEIKVETYVFTEIAYPDGDGVAVLSFWRISTLTSAQKAMEHVFDSYEAAHTIFVDKERT